MVMPGKDTDEGAILRLYESKSHNIAVVDAVYVHDHYSTTNPIYG